MSNHEALTKKQAIARKAYVVVLPVIVILAASLILVALEFVNTGVPFVVRATVSTALAELLLVAVSIPFLKRVRDTYSREKLPENLSSKVKRFAASIGTGLGLQFVTILVSAALVTYAGKTTSQEVVSEIYNLNGLWFFFCVFVLLPVIAPVAEELFFRKLLYNSYKLFFKADTFLVPALVSSVVFGLFHFQYTGSLTDLSYVLFPFVSGFLFCCLYERFKSVKYNIVAHSCYNLVSSFFLVLSFLGQ